jgi:hypothetical protein
MIVALFGSGSCSGYLKSDGTCSTPGGTWASITNGAQTGSGTSQLNTLPGNISPRAVGTGAAAVATGVNWTANGYDAGRANTTGVGWTATGSAAGYYSTTGSNWTATGVQTGYYSTTGSNWTATGSTAGYNNQTGSGWTATGMQAGFFNQTGSNWTANGFDAGMYIADGATPNESGNNSVYEGANAYPLADGDTNETVIGYAAIGHGSNTVTLGNSTTTGTYYFGSLNNANGPVIPQTALGTQGPAAGYVTTSISGTATLVSGTVTVSSTAACAVSSSCHYSLTRYATNSSVAIGNLSVGTISAGSSFVINSLTATDTIATTDVSSVSWQVN